MFIFNYMCLDLHKFHLLNIDYFAYLLVFPWRLKIIAASKNIYMQRSTLGHSLHMQHKHAAICVVYYLCPVSGSIMAQRVLCMLHHVHHEMKICLCSSHATVPLLNEIIKPGLSAATGC